MDRRYYSNIDINSAVTPFLNRAAGEKSPCRETLYPFVDVYRDTQVTDVLFDIFCQYSNTDSRIFSDYAYKYAQKTENGQPVDYHDFYTGLYAFNKEYGIDPYAVWFDRCRQNGIRPWISIRMNDCHCPDDETSFLRSDFFYKARANGWCVGEKYGYYRWCFDYSVPEVRDMMLAYIAEQTERYDVDGLELDFSREIICFDYPDCPDRVEIMNGFMREVKKTVSKAEKRLGHRIRTGVRLMRDIDQCLYYGFDAATWEKEKLADMICVCPRWASCDSDMPVAEWKNRLKHTEISAGVTDLVLKNTDNIGLSRAVVSGYTVKYLSEGADSMYLFNMFQNPYDTESKNGKYNEINRFCGTSETAGSMPYRYIETYQDSVPSGFKPYDPFPVEIAESRVRFTMNPGYIGKGRKCSLVLGFSEGGAADVKIIVNGKEYRFEKSTGSRIDTDSLPYCKKGTVLYRAETGCPDTGEINIEFIPKGHKTTVNYAEIEVI